MSENTPAPRRANAEDLNAFLSGYDPAVQTLVHAVRALALEIVPDAFEQIDLPAKLLAYGFALTYKSTVCVIIPLKAGVNLGFPRGVDLPDPSGLLTGTGKRARHVRLSEMAQAASPAVGALLEASAGITSR
ncbi:MAG: DUF1801 domain-containing protein [Candidatus Latescibacterota bacterium]